MVKTIAKKMTPAPQRRSYSDEIKAKAVAKVESGESMTKVAADLSKELGWKINLNNVSNWVMKAKGIDRGEGASEPSPRSEAPVPRENKALARENQLLRLELDYLRKKEAILRRR